MPDGPTRLTPRQRLLIIDCAIGVGSLSAVLCGVGLSSSGSAGPAGASARVETVFAPGPAAGGFLAGALIGGLVGFLWGRGGLAGAVGFVLVTLLGGCAGLAVAGLVGAETRVTVSGNSVATDHGAPTPVLLGGAVLGIILGAIGAWYFGRTASSGDSRSGHPA